MKTLTEQDFREAAADLGCEVAAIKAVAEVESAGAGFLRDGRPKILFERHHFHRLTRGKWSDYSERREKDGKEVTVYPYADISSPKSGGYKGGAAEWARFSRAFALDPQAAMKSASWGKFQIMGFNHRAAGFDTVDAFVDAMKTGEREHLMAFVSFVRANNLDDDIRRKAWASFAKGYNGAAYRKNEYDTKMAAAYRKHLRTPVQDSAAPAATSAQPIESDPAASGPDDSSSPATSAADTSPAPVPESPSEGQQTQETAPVAPTETIPAIPPLPVTVPGWIKQVLGWGAGLNFAGIGTAFATLRDNPAALVAVLTLLKWMLAGLAGIAALVAVGVLVKWMWHAKLANDLNVARLRNFADPNTRDVDFQGWKGEDPAGVKK